MKLARSVLDMRYGLALWYLLCIEKISKPWLVFSNLLLTHLLVSAASSSYFKSWAFSKSVQFCKKCPKEDKSIDEDL